jgi:biotin carboxylase
MTAASVAIVDAYASNIRLAQEFMTAGHPVVRVQSTATVPPAHQAPFSMAGFAGNIVHDGDIGATVAALEPFRPVAVLTGGEFGIELADRLSEVMGLATNGSARSGVRRNKFLQIEAVRAAGLAGTDQVMVTGEAQLTGWHAERPGRIVLKPLRSAAGDGVHFCDTPQESVAAYRALREARNIFGIVHEGVVAQRYLSGAEYIVNTVSCAGRHQVTDVWRYSKITLGDVRDLLTGARLLPGDGDVQRRLGAYAGAVLDALGIRHGPTHLEIKLEADGPHLVEIGARICGNDVPFFAAEATGQSQLSWTVDAYLDPDRFAARHGTTYRLAKHFATAVLISPVAGTLRSYPHLDRIKAMESFFDVRLAVRPGDRLVRSVDRLTRPATVNLCHESDEVLRNDLAAVRYLDGEGFYDLEPA